ncbi:Phage head morphogenesis domain containing protein [uncultured Caudovirales phage]|uniref:Phage head morphogenesis domain containing protein n=1 Tax=uncultured Caudovirales phage TaxID=2100421 RepID=A0A6J5L0R3_9CAUD|nr:Phage head morphogenesis domain containing protein [uncultured Caudovirales phage]
MSLSYSIHKCDVCAALNSKNNKPFFNKYELESFLHSIYYGDINTSHLPTSLYLKTAKEIEDYLMKGFGKINSDEQSKKVSKMRRNVYYFAAAKTYTMVNEIQKVNEKLDKNYVKYQTESTDIVKKYLDDYLYTEKDHAKHVGKAGKNWSRFESSPKTLFLEYVTMKDNRVRPAHIYLDGIIRNEKDNFWNTFMPPNGWNCRCKVKSYKEGENTNLKDFDINEALQNVPVMFRENFGKNGVVFPHDHPYFKNADKELARKNFNLPLPYANK